MKAILPAFCLLLLSANLSADEVRLQDGRVLIGRVSISGKWLTIKTRVGKVRVNRNEVLRLRDDQELRAELAGLAKRSDLGSFHSNLELARVARGYGLQPEMWAYLDHAQELGRQREEMPARLGKFLGSLEGEILPTRLHNAKIPTRVKALLLRIRPRSGAAMKAAVHEILTNMQGASKALRQRARRAGSAMQRIAALSAIADRSEPGSRKFVYRRAIIDRDADLRHDAMLMMADDGHAKEAVRYLAPGLTHASLRVRERTADAMATLGDSSAIHYLVAAGPAAAAASTPRGARAHMAVTQQESFIHDFDVEIAQSAFIADPKIAVLQSGVVLDVTVLGSSTMRVQIVDSYRRALKTLSGDDPGPRTQDWSGWLARSR